MPTIAPALTRSPSAAGTAKGAPTIIGVGSTGSSFEALLGGPPADGGAAATTARQPVAVGGTALPAAPGSATVSPATPTAMTEPEPFVIEQVPAPIVPATPKDTLTVDALPDPVVIEDKPMPDVADPRIALPLVAPQTLPAGRIADIAVATTALTPLVPAAKAKGDTDEKRPANDDPTTVATIIPIMPFVTLPIVAQAAAPAPTGAAKTPAQPLISVAAAPDDTAPPAPSTPQVGRDIQWTSIATAAVVPLAAPVSPSAPAPAPEPVVQVGTTAAQPVALPIALATQADPATTPQLVSGPALQVFGAAIQAAATREKNETTAADPASSIAGIAPAVAPAIAAVGDAAAQPQLDMSHSRWPHAMVDHIEQLRDAANATDTRIRLIPDALGTIDVSVKRDGDTVHVHFAAEQAATRTLIQDAQPRLAAIAEERGLRLGQTAVDAGTTGSNAQPQRQPPRDATTSPAPRAATTANDDADTGRLA